MQFKIWIKAMCQRWKIRLTDKIRIVCGASATQFEGWVSFNIDTLDITKDKDFKYFFEKRKIDNILLEHVIEHLEYDDFIIFLGLVRKYLKKGALVRVAVPDGNHPSQYIRELTGIRGTEPGADDHKYLYKIEDMDRIASQMGFKLSSLEYFDPKGEFVIKDYNFENGYVSRCSKNYIGRFTESSDEYDKMINTVPEEFRPQFEQKGISYTSLLVDFINE